MINPERINALESFGSFNFVARKATNIRLSTPNTNSRTTNAKKLNNNSKKLIPSHHLTSQKCQTFYISSRRNTIVFSEEQLKTTFLCNLLQADTQK